MVTSVDPEMAADIANAVAESYRDYNREQINKRTIDTKEFIEKQLNLVSGRLKEAEENLKNFQQDRNIVVLDAQTNNDLNVIGRPRDGIRKARTVRTTTCPPSKEGFRPKTLSGKELFPILEEDIHSNLFSLNDGAPEAHAGARRAHDGLYGQSSQDHRSQRQDQ